MAEVPDSGKHHCQSEAVRRCDHFSIAHGSAGLDCRGNPVFRRFLQRRPGKERKRPKQ